MPRAQVVDVAENGSNVSIPSRYAHGFFSWRHSEAPRFHQRDAESRVGRPVAVPAICRLFFAMLFVIAVATIRPSSHVMASDDASSKPSLKPASAAAPDIPFNDFDAQAEQLLLDLANRARAQAGAPALTFDAGLRQAARIHAQAMFANRELSHQFAGEAPLVQRLAVATRTVLDQEGENVAFDLNAADGHKHLMFSAPHRANLLNTNYNVVGIGVVRGVDRLYIVQDFGHALPNYSVLEVKDRIAAKVAQARRESSQPALAHRDLAQADAAACSMAQADKLGTAPIQALAQHYTVLTYTTLYPETLPAQAARVIANHNLHSVSVGACFSRTESYPAGVYWIVLSLE